MIFSTLNFDKLNEADVREEIIAPLLRECGYRSGTENNIIREQSLRYPRAFIGRKKEKKDPLLRGKADYICEVDSIRWVIEAKDPSTDIGIDAIEQAYTYACHPEVRAVYFCITNGHKIVFYQTTHGPESQPILSVSYTELNDSVDVIKNLISPDALKHQFPKIEVSTSKPLGPGLRSVVRIANGSIVYVKNNLGSLPLVGLTVSITDGALERDESGKMIAFIRTRSPYQAHQNLNEKLGLDKFEAYSETESLSTDPANPTVFTIKNTVFFQKEKKFSI